MHNRSHFISLLVLSLILIACSTTENLNSGSTPATVQKFKANTNFTKALAEAGITTYDGDTPPNINGVYNTNTSSIYSSSSNLSIMVGQSLSTIYKLYGQSGTDIYSSEQYPDATFSTGEGAIITGTGNNFTFWQENNNSTGSTTYSIISGQKLSNNDLQIKGMTVYTANPGSGLVVGDWWAYSPKLTNISGGSTGTTNPYGNGNGEISFYVTHDTKDGGASVYIDGIYKGIISSYYGSGVPTCGNTGVDLILKTGSHTLNAYTTNKKYTWSQTVTATEGQCVNIELSF